MMCVHDEKKDMTISVLVRKYGSYEKSVSQIIKALLNIIKLHEDNKKTMYLDVGANLGMHTLYAAKLGYPVWAVEPQMENIIKVRFENGISNCTNYIYIYI